MLLHRIEALRDPFWDHPWLATARHVAIAALERVERIATNLKTALDSTSPQEKACKMPDGMAKDRDQRWLH